MSSSLIVEIKAEIPRQPTAACEPSKRAITSTRINDRPSYSVKSAAIIEANNPKGDAHLSLVVSSLWNRGMIYEIYRPKLLAVRSQRAGIDVNNTHIKPTVESIEMAPGV